MLPPIIERELRVALRKRGARKSRLQAAAIGSGIVAFFLLIGWGVGTRSSGKNLHEWLFYIGLYYTVLPPFQISAGLFSEERRNQTLELLYLTGMNSGELFIGKLLGATLVASCDLLALSPLLAVPFLCGGVSVDLFLATIACFPVLLFFILAVGTFASAVCTDDGAAQVLMVAIIAALSLSLSIPYKLGLGLYGSPPFSAHWLGLCPAYGPYLVWSQFAGGTPANFWMATAIVLGWTLFFLALAAIMLKLNWRKDLERSAHGGGPGVWQTLAHGTPAWRTALRRRLLRRNAFQWLAQRDRRPVMLAWGVIIGLALVWLCGWATWPRAWPSCANFFTCALVLLLATNWLKLYAATRRIGEDRRDGVLELLLTTPLATKEILEGQIAALRAQFRPIRRTVLLLYALMMGGGLLTRTWTTPALVSYFLIWIFIIVWFLEQWLVYLPYSAARMMWIAVNSGRPVYSVFAAYGRPWYWFWLAFNFRDIIRSFGKGAGSFPSGSYMERFLIILVVVLGAIFMIGRWAGYGKDSVCDRLLAEMRSIAADPVPDPKDPRFKKWNVETRLQPALSYNFPRLPRPFPRETQLG